MTTQHKKQEPNYKIGILGCIGGLFLQLIAGSLYQWGIISIYITSYFKMMDSTLTLEQTSIASPIMMICSGITIALGLRLASAVHPLIVLTSVQILQALSVFISSYMTNFWLFVLFYGIIFGLITGAGFMIPIFQCNKYLVGKKMYVNGFILVGTGLGSVVFGLFSYSFLNPKEVSPRNGYYLGAPEVEDIALQLPTLLKWLSLMYLGIGLLGTLMVAPVILRNREAQIEHQKREKQKQEELEASKKAKHHQIQLNPQIKIQHQVQTNQENQNHSQNPQDHENKKSQHHHNHLTKHQLKHMHQANSIGQAMQSRVFWISNLILLMSSAGVFLINSNYKTYVKAYIHDDKFLTTIGVIGAVGNGCSRFFWNLYFNKTGFKTVLLTILTLLMIVFATIRFTVTNQSAYLIEVFVVNCCLGGFLVATPTGLQSIYGHTTGSKIYAVYMVNFALANFIAWVYISQLSNVIGFNNVIYICLFMMGIAVPMVVLIKFQGPWENDTSQLEFYTQFEIEKRQKERVENQHSNHHEGDLHVSQVMMVTPLKALSHDQKHSKASDSTASHITSLGQFKLSKKVLPQIEKKVTIQRLELTSLKIINESPESPRNVQMEETKNPVISSWESSDALFESKVIMATK